MKYQINHQLKVIQILSNKYDLIELQGIIKKENISGYKIEHVKQDKKTIRYSPQNIIMD